MLTDTIITGRVVLLHRRDFVKWPPVATHHLVCLHREYNTNYQYIQRPVILHISTMAQATVEPVDKVEQEKDEKQGKHRHYVLHSP